MKTNVAARGGEFFDAGLLFVSPSLTGKMHTDATYTRAQLLQPAVTPAG